MPQDKPPKPKAFRVGDPCFVVRACLDVGNPGMTINSGTILSIGNTALRNVSHKYAIQCAHYMLAANEVYATKDEAIEAAKKEFCAEIERHELIILQLRRILLDQNLYTYL